MWSLAVALLAASPTAQWLGPKPVSAPQRVVTLAPSLTETVLALDAGTTLVGVSRYDELAEVAALPRVGGFSDPSVEAVIALQPQLVIVQRAPGNQGPVETLARLGIPVLSLSLTSIADVLGSIDVLGQALGRQAEAKTLHDGIERARGEVRARAKQRPHPRTLFVFGFSPLVVAGPGGFAHELMGDLGLVNLAQAAPTAYPLYSVERLIALKPALIIDAADTAEGREALRALAPLAKTRWVTLPSKKLLHPGPALADGLVELEKALAP